jgi:cystathionine beta-lyase
VLRGIKTLHLRMQRHCEMEKNSWILNNHPKVNTVYYPGLPSDPFHEIAKSKCVVLRNGFFNFVSGKKKMQLISWKIKLFTLAESLGGVESLANYSVMMAHASIPEDKRNWNHRWFSSFERRYRRCRDLIDDLKKSISINILVSFPPSESDNQKPNSKS